MTREHIQTNCRAIIAIPTDGSPIKRIPIQGRTPAQEIEKLQRTGRYKAVFLQFLAPNALRRYGLSHH